MVELMFKGVMFRGLYTRDDVRGGGVALSPNQLRSSSMMILF